MIVNILHRSSACAVLALLALFFVPAVPASAQEIVIEGGSIVWDTANAEFDFSANLDVAGDTIFFGTAESWFDAGANLIGTSDGVDIVGSLTAGSITTAGSIVGNDLSLAAGVIADGDIEILTDAGEFIVRGTSNEGLQWNDVGATVQARIFRWGSSDDRLMVSNNGPGDLTGVYLPNGATAWVSSSDERLKFDIEPVTGILEKIRDIRVVEFNMAALGVDPYSDEVLVDFNRPARTRPGSEEPIKQELGSIAQDWLEHFPQLVDEPMDEDAGFYGLSYERIGIIAIGAIQELEARVAELERQLEEARR